jgi:ribosomal protein S18 acetylase RimI-like enzyme
MADRTASERDSFLAFELALDDRVSDEVRRERWGRAYLAPSLPLIWDASWVGIEQAGLDIAEVLAIADDVLGGAGFAHRTICLLDEADGTRLGAEFEAGAADWPAWEVERTRDMAWRGGPAVLAEPPAAREVGFAEVAGLRRRLIAESMQPGQVDFEATVDQLLALDRRYSERCGDRWFVAPAESEPASACRLYRAGGIAQVEDVGTLLDCRERGHAKAIVLAAVAAAQAAGDKSIFLTAEAADWPQLMYAKLGFEVVGDLTILRRRP